MWRVLIKDFRDPSQEDDAEDQMAEPSNALERGQYHDAMEHHLEARILLEEAQLQKDDIGIKKVVLVAACRHIPSSA